jgi:ketosteroid isomerase-like protein
MAHANQDLILRGYKAFADGNLPALFALMDGNVTWHIPGNSLISGEYRGHEQVAGLIAKSAEMTGGTLRFEIKDALANDERVVILATLSATRQGTAHTQQVVHLWRVADGKIAEFRGYADDQAAEDRFWS